MVGNRPPYSRNVKLSDKYDVADVPESVMQMVYGSPHVWVCENNHTNFTRFREGRNQSVSCSDCSERYRI